MKTIKSIYETPSATAVEVKMETGILISSPMWVILGTESATPTSEDYGVQDYGSGGTYEW